MHCEAVAVTSEGVYLGLSCAIGALACSWKHEDSMGWSCEVLTIATCS